MKTLSSSCGCGRGLTKKDVEVIIIPQPNGARVFASGSTERAPSVPPSEKPVIVSTVAYLRSLGIRRFIVPGYPEESRVPSLLVRLFGCSTEFCFPETADHPGIKESLFSCSEFLRFKRVLIISGETFFRFPSEDLENPCFFELSFILWHRVKIPHAWPLVVEGQHGKLQNIILKNRQIEDPSVKAAVGVYGVTQWSKLLSTLMHYDGSPDSENDADLSYFLRNYLLTEDVRCLECTDWFNSNHYDPMQNTRQHVLCTRSFNTIEFDSSVGVIKKSSTKSGLLADEINYYLSLPEDKKIYFPKMHTYSLDVENVYLSLEYYPYPTLTEHLLFGSLSTAAWKGVFTQIKQILFDFHASPIETDISYANFLPYSGRP